tara:strand:+ start:1590 stop:1964 length:375 start_codon:yes stop_codon:yes gene_type:complete
MSTLAKKERDIMNAGCGSGTTRIVDDWEVHGERFRLLRGSSGPMWIKTINPHTNDAEWKNESACYTHSLLCQRVESLVNICERRGIAIRDALSAFNNEDGETTVVNEERLEAWEESLVNQGYDQ